MQTLLDRREERARLQNRLIAEYGGTLIVIRPNFPGADKRNIFASFATVQLYWEITKELSMTSRNYTYQEEGLIFYSTVAKPACTVKEVAVHLEETHPLGRLVDIDVMDPHGEIGRGQLNLPPRTCFLCEERAVVCVRDRRHSVNEITDWFIDRVVCFLRRGSLPERIRQYTEFAVIAELSRVRGYGCVTWTDTGSHDDMNAWTFLDSTRAMMKELSTTKWMAPYSFEELRSIGIRIEEAMQRATKGVNAQRGLLFFVLLINNASLAARSLDELSQRIRELSQPLQTDFDTMVRSHGMRIFREHGVQGARGMALSGLQEAMDDVLPAFLIHPNVDALTLDWMGRIMDTTAIHRAGIEGWQEIQMVVRNAMDDRAQAAIVDKICKQNRISTGGVADLVSVTILLAWIQEEFTNGDQKKSRLRDLEFE